MRVRWCERHPAPAALLQDPFEAAAGAPAPPQCCIYSVIDSQTACRGEAMFVQLFHSARVSTPTRRRRTVTRK